MIPLCLNCLTALNDYGSCDKCNRLLIKEIEERRKNELIQEEAKDWAQSSRHCV